MAQALKAATPGVTTTTLCDRAGHLSDSTGQPCDNSTYEATAIRRNDDQPIAATGHMRPRKLIFLRTDMYLTGQKLQLCVEFSYGDSPELVK